MKRSLVISAMVCWGMASPIASFVTSHPFQSSHMRRRQQKPRERVVVREPFMETGMTVIGIHHNPRFDRQKQDNTTSSQHQQQFSTKDLQKVTHPLALWINLCLVSLLGSSMNSPNTRSMLPSPFGPDSVLPDDSSSSIVSLLRDMSHLALDLFTVCSPSMLGMRVASVAGRFCSLAADYLPDHYMPLDEGIFQIVMLYVAVSGLVKSTTYHLVASHLTPSRSSEQLEDSLYETLFSPAGFSWQQFKCLMAYSADWCVLSPGDTVAKDEPEDIVYLLVEGTVTQTLMCGTEGPMSERDLSSGEAGRNKFLLGEVDALWKLPTRRRAPGVNLLDRIFSTGEEECVLEAPCCEDNEVAKIQWTAKEGDARLLRMDLGTLSTLIREYDNGLEEPLRNLAFDLARATMDKTHQW